MYIRTVWVDGFRHAILTRDDPHYIELYAKRRRPHSSASVNHTRKSQSSRLSHRSDTNLYRSPELIVKSDRIRIGKDLEIETLNLTEVEAEEKDIQSSLPSECEAGLTRPNYIDTSMRAVKSNRTARAQVREANELSDRVLQWLDLAGKVDLLATGDADRICQARHSWPEIQRRNLPKSRTATDLRARQCKQSGDASQTGDAIDRDSLYVPTSAATIENYAKRSRDTKHPSRDVHNNTRDNKKVKDMRISVAETRQKMMNERSAMEKQYKELVNKKIIPDLGKTKKQVHIFMPEAINKRIACNTNSRTESLLSQKS